jgi:hypothetical protein
VVPRDAEDSRPEHQLMVVAVQLQAPALVQVQVQVQVQVRVQVQVQVRLKRLGWTAGLPLTQDEGAGAGAPVG